MEPFRGRPDFENLVKKLSLPRSQVAGIIKAFAYHFFPQISTSQPNENGKIQGILREVATKLNNDELCRDVSQVQLLPDHPFSSLAQRYRPENKFEESIIGCGSAGLKAAEVLEEIEDDFEIYIFNQIPDPGSRQFKKLPPELQLLFFYGVNNQEINQQISSFLNDGGIFIFSKRKKIPPEVTEIIYQLSLLTGRRLDWLEKWIIFQQNGGDFPFERFFGRQPKEKRKEIYKLLKQLNQFSPTFFQLIPIDKNGQVNNDLEKKINDPFQDLENLYGQMLLTSADWDEELKVTRLAFALSILGILLVNHLLEGNPVLARAIPPALADILTLWAEGSPFIDRTLPPKKRLYEFAKLIAQKYQVSVIFSGILSLTGSQFVEWLKQRQMLIEAGFAYAFIPFVGALITTAQSFFQEYQKGKKLKELGVFGFSDLDQLQLLKEAFLATVTHPARLWLLIAGAIGVGEGAIIGALNLLDNPVALTFVGEFNESFITLIGLLIYNQILWRKYQKKLKEKIDSLKNH